MHLKNKTSHQTTQHLIRKHNHPHLRFVDKRNLETNQNITRQVRLFPYNLVLL